MAATQCREWRDGFHHVVANSTPMTRKILTVPMGGVAFVVGFAGGYAAIGPRLVAELARLNPAPMPAAPAASNPSVSFDAASEDAAPGIDAKGPADGARAAIGRVMAGYIDRTGEWAIAAQFADARPFKDGMGRVAIGDRWGFIDP